MSEAPTTTSNAPSPEVSGDEVAPAGDRPAWRRWAEAAVLALPTLLLLERAWDRRWMTDDGFINLRVVRMVLEGHGPVFNVGERVEVTTSTLWLWTLVAGDIVLPLRLEWVAVLSGLALAVAGLGLATAGAARLHGFLAERSDRGEEGGPARRPLLVPAGAAVVAVLSPVWDFSTSGLEGGLVFGWLGLTGWLLARWARAGRRLGAVAAAVIGLGPLVRPDLFLVSAVALAGVLAAQWRDDRLADRLRLLVAAGALPVAYQTFRMGYYASLVPNTALAKAGGRSRWGTGFDYLRDLVQPYWLVLPVVTLLLAGLVPAVLRARASGERRALVALLALPVAGVLDALYVVRVGGDYMHGRLLLPALFALMAPVAALPLPIPRRPLRAREGLAGVGVATAAAWSLVCLAGLRPDSTPAVDGLFSSDARAGNVRLFGEHAVTAADQGWGPGQPHTRLPPGTLVHAEGRPIPVDPPPELRTPAHAGYGVGIAGYVYGPDVYVIDMLGLADPVTSRFSLPRPGLTGHEKPMPLAWLAARISERPVDPARLPQPALARPIHESPAGGFEDDVAAARRALACDELTELMDAVRQPMTPGRFLSNLVAAPRLTRLSIPPAPGDAAERFCG